jgi:hypothetical protein
MPTHASKSKKEIRVASRPVVKSGSARAIEATRKT